MIQRSKKQEMEIKNQNRKWDQGKGKNILRNKKGKRNGSLPVRRRDEELEKEEEKGKEMKMEKKKRIENLWKAQL